MKLQPEQETAVIAELKALEPVLQDAMDEYVEMRHSGHDLVTIIGLMNSSLDGGENFNHIEMARDSLLEDGCTHIVPQLNAFTCIFYLIGRHAERRGAVINSHFVSE